MTLRCALLLCCALAAAAPPVLAPVDEAAYPKTVAGLKGKVVLVNFWATYCVPCRKEMPQLVALDARLRAKGFQLVTVSADEPEQEADARKFLEKTKVAGPWHIKRARNDDQFIRAIDPKWSGALPASFLYNRQGRKVQAFFGEVDFKALEAAVAKLL